EDRRAHGRRSKGGSDAERHGDHAPFDDVLRPGPTSAPSIARSHLGLLECELQVRNDAPCRGKPRHTDDAPGRPTAPPTGVKSTDGGRRGKAIPEKKRVVEVGQMPTRYAEMCLELLRMVEGGLENESTTAWGEALEHVEERRCEALLFGGPRR